VSELVRRAAFALILSWFAVAAAHAKPRADEIPVPPEDQVCARNTDCALTTLVCGCCVFTPINKKKRAAYQKLEANCAEPPPPCSCKAPVVKARCVQKRCTAVPIEPR